MDVLERGLPSPKQKGRAVLSVRDPLVESLLGGLGFEEKSIAELRPSCKRLDRDRNLWDLARRRRGGLFGRKLDRDEADALLARLIAGLAQGGEP